LIEIGGNGNLGEDISDAMFDLVNADRLAIVSELSLRKQKLTALSKVLNCTVQECSRHLNRLSNSGFIKKDQEGHYEITSFGRAMLNLIPSFRFLVKEREYFLSHDLSFLPQGFIERIGELSAGEYLNHFTKVFEIIKKVISTGKEYVWIISDNPVIVGSSPGSAFYSSNVPARFISHINVDRGIVAKAKSALPHSEIATLLEVKLAIVINESIAGVCFPSVDGKIDFGAGYTGSDPQFRSWCTDLFELYWSKSRKIQSVLQL
jgi:predicted transcriptional regulator